MGNIQRYVTQQEKEDNRQYCHYINVMKRKNRDVISNPLQQPRKHN